MKTINIHINKWGENYEFVDTHIDSKINSEDFVPKITYSHANKWGVNQETHKFISTHIDNV